MTKKSGNTNLSNAKREKNDEFYTQLTDIEKELGHYIEHFKGKTIFCNCDDPEESNFFRYFALNFTHLGIKKLIATHFEAEKPSYKLEITSGLDLNKDGKIDLKDTNKINLTQNGDFRSDEAIEILKSADIVVTNPPFSLFREYVAQLFEYNKKFLIIGSDNSVTYKEIFKLIKDNKIWLGYGKVKEFKQPNGNIKKFGNVGWYTNLEISKRHEEIILYKTYNEKEYQKYDNYNIINIDKIKDIPVDYSGIMGVPITFLNNYNPDQFEVLGISNSARYIGYECFTLIKGRKVYNRIIIKNKKL